MREWTTAVLCLGLAVGASVLTTAFTAPRDAAARDTDELDAELAGLARALSSATERNESLAERIARLETAGAVAPSSTRVAVGELDRAVERWMERNSAATPDGAAEDPPRSLELDEVMPELLFADLSGAEKQALWEDIRQAGLVDEAIAHIEALVEADPGDADLRTELGQACIQKIFELGQGPMVSVYGQKADEAFDAALEIDGEHWRARFSKGVSLSRWPAFLGKSGEAIRQFEILAGQQEQGAAEPRFAQTYYFLGNLYLETGETEKAVAAWQRGLALFPDDDSLRLQVDLAGE